MTMKKKKKPQISFSRSILHASVTKSKSRHQSLSHLLIGENLKELSFSSHIITSFFITCIFPFYSFFMLNVQRSQQQKQKFSFYTYYKIIFCFYLPLYLPSLSTSCFFVRGETNFKELIKSTQHTSIKKNQSFPFIFIKETNKQME